MIMHMIDILWLVLKSSYYCTELFKCACIYCQAFAQCFFMQSLLISPWYFWQKAQMPSAMIIDGFAKIKKKIEIRINNFDEKYLEIEREWKIKYSYAVIRVVSASCSCAHSGQSVLEFTRELFNNDFFALTSAFVPFFVIIGLSENESKLFKSWMKVAFVTSDNFLNLSHYQIKT